MKFSENNSNSIIDEMFNGKYLDYEQYICDHEQKGKDYFSRISLLIENLKSSTNTKKEKEEYCEELDKLISHQLEYWERKYYKLGFIDGARMAEDVKTETRYIDED